MCGRYHLIAEAQALSDAFAVERPPHHRPRYNIAPGQWVPMVVAWGGQRHLEAARWGLLPGWVKEPRADQPINARLETVASKPYFRAAYRSRRALLPATGFYEWQGGARRYQQPYHLHLADWGLFAFAALWEFWRDPSGEPLVTCCLLTQAASTAVAQIHQRMPVVVPPACYSAWLGQADTPSPAPDPDRFPATDWVIEAVSLHVNNPRHDDPACLRPRPRPAAAEPNQTDLLLQSPARRD